MFNENDILNGKFGSIVPSNWLNAIQEELGAILESNNISLNSNLNNQIATYLNNRFSNIEKKLETIIEDLEPAKNNYNNIKSRVDVLYEKLENFNKFRLENINTTYNYIKNYMFKKYCSDRKMIFNFYENMCDDFNKNFFGVIIPRSFCEVFSAEYVGKYYSSCLIYSITNNRTFNYLHVMTTLNKCSKIFLADNKVIYHFDKENPGRSRYDKNIFYKGKLDLRSLFLRCRNYEGENNNNKDKLYIEMDNIADHIHQRSKLVPFIIKKNDVKKINFYEVSYDIIFKFSTLYLYDYRNVERCNNMEMRNKYKYKNGFETCPNNISVDFCGVFINPRRVISYIYYSFNNFKNKSNFKYLSNVNYLELFLRNDFWWYQNYLEKFLEKNYSLHNDLQIDDMQHLRDENKIIDELDIEIRPEGYYRKGETPEF